MFEAHDYLITHANCLDGVTCAGIFVLFGGNKNHIIYSSPSHSSVDTIVENVLNNACRDKGNLYLADISLSQNMAEKISHRSNIFLFDHHKSAIPLAKYPWCMVDKENSKCGSMIFLYWCIQHFDYFNLPRMLRKNLEHFVEIVDDRDRWINSKPESQDLSQLFFLLGQTMFFERFLDRIEMAYESPANLTTEEEYLLFIDRQKKNEYIENLKHKVVVQNLEGKQVGFVLCNRYISDAGHSLCDALDLDAVALVSNETISLRAPIDSPLDMSDIAKHYRGGGHAGAAGFQTSALIGETLLNKVISKFHLP